MKFVRFARLLTCFVFYSTGTFCQHYFYNNHYTDPPVVMEVGLGVGIMNCLTDLGGNRGAPTIAKDVTLRNSHLCAALFYHALYRYTWGLQLNLLAGSVSAGDHNIRSENAAARLRKERNLHFESKIREFNILAEWYFLSSATQLTRLLPFVAAGIGTFRFKPRALLDGQWVDLPPLFTEGQGFTEYPQRTPYSLRQLNLPVALGCRYEPTAAIALTLEFQYRFLFTDYLDDVSTTYINPVLFETYLPTSLSPLAQRLADRRRELNPNALANDNQPRGNPSRNDGYYSCQLKIAWVLNRKRIN